MCARARDKLPGHRFAREIMARQKSASRYISSCRATASCVLSSGIVKIYGSTFLFRGEKKTDDFSRVFETKV